jgi:hypothetical protein
MTRENDNRVAMDSRRRASGTGHVRRKKTAFRRSRRKKEKARRINGAPDGTNRRVGVKVRRGIQLIDVS